MTGRIEVELRHRNHRQNVVCEPGDRGLLIERDVWSQQTYREEGSTLLVICSLPFEKDSYVPDEEQA